MPIVYAIVFIVVWLLWAGFLIDLSKCLYRSHRINTRICTTEVHTHTHTHIHTHTYTHIHTYIHTYTTNGSPIYSIIVYTLTSWC